MFHTYYTTNKIMGFTNAKKPVIIILKGFYMKRFILTLLLFLGFATAVYADPRSFTVRYGVDTIDGFIPLSAYGAYTDCDPYIFYVERQKYYMVKDDIQPYNRNSLLGCGDMSKDSLYRPLLNLNKDNDNTKLTPEELKAANIRFVKQKIDGKLDLYNKNSDFDLDRIAYIDIKNIRIATTFAPSGSFDIYLKTSTKSLKKVIAKVEARTHFYVDRMF